MAEQEEWKGGWRSTRHRTASVESDDFSSSSSSSCSLGHNACVRKCTHEPQKDYGPDEPLPESKSLQELRLAVDGKHGPGTFLGKLNGKERQSLLRELCDRGELALFQVVYEASQLSGRERRKLLEYVAKEGQVAILADLLDSLPTSQERVQELLEETVRKAGTLPVLQLLVERGAVVNRTVSRGAVSSDDPAILEYILTLGVCTKYLKSMLGCLGSGAEAEQAISMAAVLRQHDIDPEPYLTACLEETTRPEVTDRALIMAGADLRVLAVTHLYNLYKDPWHIQQLSAKNLARLPYELLVRCTRFRRRAQTALAKHLPRDLAMYVWART